MYWFESGRIAGLERRLETVFTLVETVFTLVDDSNGLAYIGADCPMPAPPAQNHHYKKIYWC